MGQFIKGSLNKAFLIVKSIRVEIPIFFSLTSQIISNIILQDLALYQGCTVDLGYSKEICDAVRFSNVSSSKIGEAVLASHSLVSDVSSSLAPLEYGLPLLCILLLGPLSDVFGRKLPMLVAYVGFVTQALAYVCVANKPSWSLWSVRLLIGVPRALFGGAPSYTMGALSYISDTTPTDMRMRTVRNAIYCGVYISTGPVASFIAGKLSTLQLDYMQLFMISGTLTIVGSIILIIIVPNTKDYSKAEEFQRLSFNDKLIFIIRPATTWLQVWKTLTKSRIGYKRLQIFCMLLSHFCIVAPINAEYTVRYLFAKVKLDWNLPQYGDFSSVQPIMSIIGVIVSAGVFTYWFKLSDQLIGFIAGWSQFSACFLYAFATTTASMYIASAVDFLNGSMSATGKAILSKTVELEETGSIFACIGIIDSISPLIMVPIYNQVYSATLEIFPGTFYLVSAGLTLPSLLIFGTMVTHGLLKYGRNSLFQSKVFKVDTENNKTVDDSVPENPFTLDQKL